MNFIIESFKSLTGFERLLLAASISIITLSFILFKNDDYLTLAASLIGALALAFTAKGNVLGQILIIVFALFYGYISYHFGYFGEMLTYLCMSAPVAVAAVISWLKNPYKGDKADVKVNSLKPAEYFFMIILSLAVTFAFYFILRALGTKNLYVSTLSVLTSFSSSYLTVRRSEYYAVGYSINDVVLMALWTAAAFENLNYLSMVVCFIVFLAYDLYGFIMWSKSKKRQAMPNLNT